MSPPLTSRMADALRRRLPLALLAEIEHPDGTARFWTGIGPLNWNGAVWTGAGALGNISPIQHTSDIAIQEINFTLVGVDPSVVATLNDNVRNLSGKAWLACIDESGNVVRDPFQVIDSQLDYQSLSAADDGTVSISITARSGFYTLDRALDEVWSSQDQKLQFPDDTGLDMISSLQNQNLQWTPT